MSEFRFYSMLCGNQLKVNSKRGSLKTESKRGTSSFKFTWRCCTSQQEILRFTFARNSSILIWNVWFRIVEFSWLVGVHRMLWGERYITLDFTLSHLLLWQFLWRPFAPSGENYTEHRSMGTYYFYLQCCRCVSPDPLNLSV